VYTLCVSSYLEVEQPMTDSQQKQQLHHEQEITDEITRSLKGDQTAYAAIFNRYADGLYRLCYGLLLNKEDADDVVQESFVYAFKNLKRYDSNKSAFKTWLYTIAVSRCRNIHRRKKYQLVDLSQLMQLNITAPSVQRPESQMTRRDAEATVAKALSDLSPLLREAVLLRYAHGLTYREIADVMGCPQKTAESRVRLAHEKLRGVLQAEGPGLLQELLSL